MLEKAFNWIRNHAEPHIHIGQDGKEYSDKNLHPVEAMVYRPGPPAVMNTTTLTSLVDFITKEVDEETDFPLDRIIIHIMAPGKVLLTSEVTETGERWNRVLAEAQVDKFQFGQFMDREVFNIQMQTKFVQTEQAATLLGFISKIADGAITEGEDDGITQRVTVKQGIQRVGGANVPNPVILAPFRTFPEAVQPESPFVFRLNPGRMEGAMPECALFEADGSQWRVQAMQNIKQWLTENLPEKRLEEGNIVIIA